MTSELMQYFIEFIRDPSHNLKLMTIDVQLNPEALYLITTGIYGCIHLRLYILCDLYAPIFIHYFLTHV